MWNVILLHLGAVPPASSFGTPALNPRLLGALLERWEVLANPQERLTVAQKGLFGGGLIRKTPSRDIKTKAHSFLTVSELFNSPPAVNLGNTEHHLMVWHGPAIIILHRRMKWGVIIHLSCTSAHTPMTLSVQRRLKAKTDPGRAFIRNAPSL